MKALNRLAIIIIFLATFHAGYCQELVKRINALNTLKYDSWVKTYKEFFEERKRQGITDRSGTGYKQVARLLYFNRDRLDENGNIVNSDLYNFRAYKNFVRDNQSMPFAKTTAQTAEWLYGGPGFTRSTGGVATGIGRVTFVKLDPNDAGNANSATIYVGAPKGGVWKGTFNKSTGLVPSWTCLTDGLPNIGAVDLVIHPSNRNILYLVSGDKNAGVGNSPSGIGIMKSTDGGLNDEEKSAVWEEIESELKNFEENGKFVGPCEMVVAVGEK